MLAENAFVFKFLQLLMIQLYSFCQLVQREPWSKCVLVIPFILSSSFLLWSLFNAALLVFLSQVLHCHFGFLLKYKPQRLTWF